MLVEFRAHLLRLTTQIPLYKLATECLSWEAIFPYLCIPIVIGIN